VHYTGPHTIKQAGQRSICFARTDHHAHWNNGYLTDGRSGSVRFFAGVDAAR
jgi:hypothetical protein